MKIGVFFYSRRLFEGRKQLTIAYLRSEFNEQVFSLFRLASITSRGLQMCSHRMQASPAHLKMYRKYKKADPVREKRLIFQGKPRNVDPEREKRKPSAKTQKH